MDHNLRGADNAVPYDYRQYDRVWQRVSPSLSPYPGAVPAANMGETDSAPQPPSNTPEKNLSGAEDNSCCMGTTAQEMLDVLEGFIEDELADRRYYLAFSRQAPTAARQTMREIALDEGEHARLLMAVYYLITGGCYQASVSCDRIYIGAYCPALRMRYHAEACGGLNYIRAAEGTTDPCLKKLLMRLSEDEYRHAEMLTGLLERAMAGTCNRMGTGV